MRDSAHEGTDMLKILTGLALASLVMTPATGKSCRDGKGKFVKCATVAPAKATRCKDAKGKFAKCGLPGAKRM